VVDVIAALTDSPTPRQYWGKIKDREFVKLELSPIWVQLKLTSADGKDYETDCANTKAVFRQQKLLAGIPARTFQTILLRLTKWSSLAQGAKGSF